MSHEADIPGPPSPEEERAAETVRSLGAVQPDPEFRGRLREAFVSGTIDAEAPSSSAPAGGRDTKSGTIVALFTAAIAASVAMLVWLGSAAPEWTYAGVRGDEGELWICGHVMDPDDVAGIEAMLHAGTPIKTTGSMQAEFVLQNRLTMQVAPEAELTVPSAPRRWFGGDAFCEVAKGEVRFVTGREKPGERFVIRSPLATVEITGTTFAVISDPDSSCVCVLEGEVKMIDADGSEHAVPAGQRRTVFRDADPRQEAILPMEQMKLEMLRDQGSPNVRLE